MKCFIHRYLSNDFFYNRALEIIQDEEYLDESDFDEIKRQKRKINPLTPALINNVKSSVKNGNSLSKPKLNFYNQSTVIKDFIESAHHGPIWNEPDRKRRPFGIWNRSKRQTETVTKGMQIFFFRLLYFCKHFWIKRFLLRVGVLGLTLGKLGRGCSFKT